MDKLNYSSYLGVPELLALQHPRSSPNVVETRTAEHFFIIAHQASELWICQVLLDLRLAITALASDIDDQARCKMAGPHLRRSVVGVSVLNHHLKALSELPVEEFHAFRRKLGTASGAQSHQFNEYFRIVGIFDPPGPLLEAFNRLIARYNISFKELWDEEARVDHPHLLPIAESLLDLASVTWRWQATHIKLASHFLGDAPGTGGTTGAEFLRDRLRFPFEELRPDGFERYLDEHLYKD
ncbi:tryptophan 2,3-dioxygenase family protein [Streptomyces sp. 1222.5]|uniref:tryptophan 2,3-dioxygenase family protein n=1 Tax=Streptomyces sp. 1222.5 TaxID=1881026 RepID=UPI003EBCEC5A